MLKSSRRKIDAENRRKAAIDDAIKELGHVYFDLNSSYLNATSKAVLDRLVALLNQNATVELHVTSHTDSRGRSKYNKWLSQRRVDRTKTYLIDAGIDAARLHTEAFGEEMLLNECDDTIYCPEEKHRINRRSEFVVRKY